MRNIAVFASGSGTNAENLVNYARTSQSFNVSCIYCNNANAFVIERAKKLNVPYILFSKGEFIAADFYQKLERFNVDFIVLAGFLWLVPVELIQKFPNKIINIHPALLPAYGGKGMYGHFVHDAVINNKEKESGITIHLVNENYDEGAVLFQANCKINETDTPDSLAAKIHQLEFEHFPKVVESYIQQYYK